MISTSKQLWAIRLVITLLLEVIESVVLLLEVIESVVLLLEVIESIISLLVIKAIVSLLVIKPIVWRHSSVHKWIIAIRKRIKGLSRYLTICKTTT
jgi:hypothetical protein